MNLETNVPEDLWEAVRANYERGNFTGSILDAFYFLSELLRQKSGAEGDGASLVGQALGGAAPKIKLNRLQSESEWNVQKGVEQLLRGFYQAFRNPRSHEKISDTENDARILILFTGYLVRQIDKAKSQFSRHDFIRRVLDPDFVPNSRYAELLVEDVPVGQRLEVFLDAYREKETVKGDHLRHFFNALLPTLTVDERIQVDQIISDELKTTDDDATVRAVIGSLGGDIWPRLAEVSRLRIEHKLVRSVREGRFDSKQKVCRSGGLGTWARNLFPHFTLKREMLGAITDKLRSGNRAEEDYVFQYLFPAIGDLHSSIPATLDIVFKTRIRNGSERFHAALTVYSPWEKGGWSKDLSKAVDEFKASPDFDEMDDDIPF